MLGRGPQCVLETKFVFGCVPLYPSDCHDSSCVTLEDTTTWKTLGMEVVCWETSVKYKHQVQLLSVG